MRGDRGDYPMECLGELCNRMLRPRTALESDYDIPTYPHASMGYCYACYDKVKRRNRKRVRSGKETKEIKAAAVAAFNTKNDPEWAKQAECRDVYVDAIYDPFYAPRGEQIGIVKELCGACPVNKLCLKAACESREVFGVWGGFGDENLQTAIKYYNSLKEKSRA